MKSALFVLLTIVTLNANAKCVDAFVTHIVDGDTLDANMNSEIVRVRLDGIDAPEIGQTWGAWARAALKRKVGRKNVCIVVTDTDRYGREIGRIYLDKRDINREMVRHGHAWWYRQYSNDVRLDHAEHDARHDKAGLWKGTDPVPPWEWRRR